MPILGGSFTPAFVEITKTLTPGLTNTLGLTIPGRSLLLAVQLRVDETIQASGSSWHASFIGGLNLEIETYLSFVKNTKHNEILLPDGEITTETTETDIQAYCVGGAFVSGKISAIVYYWPLEDMPDE